MSRFLVLLQLNLNGTELSSRMAKFEKMLIGFSTTKIGEAFRAGNNIAFFYSSDKSPRELTNLLSNPADGLPILRNSDRVLILELGSQFDAIGNSRNWTWLQQH